jgi:rhodanese-related sulfurtransferase
MALVAALIANSLASPARRLAWVRSSLPPAIAAPRVEKIPPPLPDSGHPIVLAPKVGRPIHPGHLPPSRIAPSPNPAAAPTAETSPSSPIRDISAEEAWRAFQSGTPFLDARRGSEFAEGHIAGAWSTPVWESDLDDRLLSFKAARRPGSEDPIVIYCSGGDCRDSHLLAEKLLGEGYFHLLIFHDGYPAWVAQGRPIEKGRP